MRETPQPPRLCQCFPGRPEQREPPGKFRALPGQDSGLHGFHLCRSLGRDLTQHKGQIHVTDAFLKTAVRQAAQRAGAHQFRAEHLPGVVKRRVKADPARLIGTCRESGGHAAQCTGAEYSTVAALEWRA